MDATGHWLGALALDFAHADDVQTAEQLGAWLRTRFDRLGNDTGERDLHDALALRAAVHRLARAEVGAQQPQADDVDTVNLFAATPDIPPALVGGQRQAGRTQVRTGQALSTIARDAVRLFSNAEGRIRECEADDCSLVFYDESRTNNRRWCSMQTCGNRAKVRAFRAKERQRENA
jgi:predicted RNA-binding Zn ribbon-like protein